jgi:hypothetical protein
LVTVISVKEDFAQALHLLVLFRLVILTGLWQWELGTDVLPGHVSGDEAVRVSLLKIL